MQCGRRVWTAGRKNIWSSIVRYRACLQLITKSISELWQLWSQLARLLPKSRSDAMTTPIWQGARPNCGRSVCLLSWVALSWWWWGPVMPVAATTQNAIIALGSEWWAVSCAVCWPVQLPVSWPYLTRPHGLLLINIMFNHYAWWADDTTTILTGNMRTLYRSSLDTRAIDWLTDWPYGS